MTQENSAEYHKNKLEISVIQLPSEIINYEYNRTKFYLQQYQVYKGKNMHTGIRFPEGVNPEVPIEENVLLEKITTEFQMNQELYSSYCGELDASAKKCMQILPAIQHIYGFDIVGHFIVGATAYGMHGSSHAYGDNGPLVSKIPEFRPKNLGSFFTTNNYRCPLEILTHELLAHTLTSPCRKNSLLDEYVNSSNLHWHKEYLMELLGIEILTQSGLMDKRDIAVQKKSIANAASDIDPIYFDENGKSKWHGNVGGLIKEIDIKLRQKYF